MPEHHEPAPSVEKPSARRLMGNLTRAISLSRAQALAGFAAALLSMSGTLFGYVSATRIPQSGDLLMVVRERQTNEPVTDAIVEVLTGSDAVVTTFPTLERNGAHRSLKEGAYRVRVTSARFAPESRVVQVFGGQTSEVRFLLSPRGVALPVEPAAPAPGAPAKAAAGRPGPTPAGPSPTATATKRLTTQAAATKPAVTTPLATKPVATKPVATKPVATKPGATKPVATKTVAAKPVAAKPVRTRPVRTKLAAKPAARPGAPKPEDIPRGLSRETP